MKIGIVVKIRQPEFAEQLNRIVDSFLERGCDLFIDERLEDGLSPKKGVSFCPLDDLPDHSDALIVFGGDGTLLSVARVIGSRHCPILGVNLGSLGFLTEVTLEEFDEAARKLIRGDFRTSRRTLLRVEVVRPGRPHLTYRALNDAVINKGALARIVSLEAFCGDAFIANFLADGIIIATPTGSTAYSLSAGGPIIVPTQDLIILTPICPHTLTNRPLIIPPTTEVRVRLVEGEDVMLTVDGQVGTEICPGDEIRCRLSDRSIELITPGSRNFFDVLRQKLKWAERS